MDKFKIDFAMLDKLANPDDNTMPLKGNEHRLVRVAFDLFRLKDGDPEELWQVQSSDDGEFLVRTFSTPEEEKIAESSNWSVEMDKKEANLTIAYKQVPLTRLAAKDYGAETPEDTMLLRRVIYRKLTTDPEFGGKLYASLPPAKQKMLRESGVLDWSSAYSNECGQDADSPIPTESPEICQRCNQPKPLCTCACKVCGGPKGMCGGHNCEKCGKPLDKCTCEGRFAQLEEYLNKRADSFEEAWWDSGMETYGPGASGTWGEIADEREDAIQKAYYMIEHELPPGSEEAVALSEFAWKVESGDEDYSDLEEMMSKIKTKSQEIDDIEDTKAIPIQLPAEDVPEDYSDYFMMKCREHGIDPNDIPGIPVEKRKALFEDIDAGWKAKSECGDAFVIARKDVLLSKKAQEDIPFAPQEWVKEEGQEMPFEGEGIGAKTLEEILEDVKKMSPEERKELEEALKGIL